MKSRTTDYNSYLNQVYPLFTSKRGSIMHNFSHKNNFEEELILTNIEKIFRKYRSFPFKMPQSGEHVILFCSGGLDSILLWAYLMDKYKLKVIPVHFSSGTSHEDQAFEYFKLFFAKKYPEHYCNALYFTYKYDFTFGTKEINNLSTDLQLIFPNSILSKNKLQMLFTKPITRIGLLAIKAFEFASLLESKKSIIVRTAFTGNMPEDIVGTRESTLTVSRTLNLFLCLLLGDFRWQFTPIALEPKYFLTKKHMVEFAQKRNIPVEKTWSCDRNQRLQCGSCVSCKQRTKIFTITHIPDKTIYKKNTSYSDIKLNLGIKKLIHMLKNRIYEYRTKTNKIPSVKLSPDTIINIKFGALFKKHKGESRVSWISNKQLHQAMINETGTLILEKLQKHPMSVEKIAEKLKEIYHEDSKLLIRHINSFVIEGLEKYLEIRS